MKSRRETCSGLGWRFKTLWKEKLGVGKLRRRVDFKKGTYYYSAEWKGGNKSTALTETSLA